MSHLFELNAFVEEGGEKKPLSLTITHPKKSEHAEDYFCTVYADMLFNEPKPIYGIDAEQASKLAMRFVRDLLSDKQLFDENGKLVSF